MPRPHFALQKDPSVQIPCAQYKPQTLTALLIASQASYKPLVTGILNSLLSSDQPPSSIVNCLILHPASVDVDLHSICSGTHTVVFREDNTLSKPSAIFRGISTLQDLIIGTHTTAHAYVTSSSSSTLLN
jgi:hypothetical protein